MPTATHKTTTVRWELMVRDGVINTERGDVHYYAGDIMITRLGTRDQYPVDPATFMASYSDNGNDLRDAIKFWDDHDIAY